MKSRSQIDKHLIRRIGDLRDPDALGKLYHHYKAKVLGLAADIHPEWAEEISQATWLRVWTHAKQFRGDSAFSSWLYRITANQALMLRRSHRKHDALIMRATDDHNSAEQSFSLEWMGSEDRCLFESLATRRLLKCVNEDVANLPKAERRVFLLRLADHSNAEVAKAEGESVPAIKSRYNRARIRLEWPHIAKKVANG